jgi:hypothetical protein
MSATRTSRRPRSECSPFGDGWTYRLQRVCCGRKKCGVCRGVRAAHGPYWYAERDANGRTRTKYIGRRLVSVADKLAGREDRYRWDGRAMTRSDALRIMGLVSGFSPEDLRRAYRTLSMHWHPDRSKHPEAQRVMVAINRAYEYLR